MEKQRRSGFSIMKDLIGLIKPLLPTMFLAITLGVLGFLCAIFITIIAGYGISRGILLNLGFDTTGAKGPFFLVASIPTFITLLILIGVSRGFLRYGEQYCNHYIAFRLLAIIRNKVFTKLRKLCPAKLEAKNKGDLISLITSDIELLEVFYAHTISPIAIAIVVSVIMTIFIGMQHPLAALIAVSAYIVIGLVIPLVNGKKGAKTGLQLRNEVGNLNGFVLGNLYGLDETIQYNAGEKMKKKMEDKSNSLLFLQKNLNKIEASQRSITNLAIQLFSLLMFFTMLTLFLLGDVSFIQMIISTIAMISSFGPVVALSNLSNNLHQTLASGERVLDILKEEPQVLEVDGKEKTLYEDAKISNVSFKYDTEEILSNCNLSISKGKIIGIHGASGSGKSTLLKLLMRFWDVTDGEIKISDKNIKEINTNDLRNMQSYVTQETWLFNDSIANNIAIGKEDATREEIEKAARAASIHDFIMTLPKGYETKVSELGDNLSGGQRQRIGIARAFLHQAPMIILDEPTSNLDSLNEGIILKSLKETYKDETVIIVSHRKSTLNIADEVLEMGSGRFS